MVCPPTHWRNMMKKPTIIEIDAQVSAPNIAPFERQRRGLPDDHLPAFTIR